MNALELILHRTQMRSFSEEGSHLGSTNGSGYKAWTYNIKLSEYS